MRIAFHLANYITCQHLVGYLSVYVYSNSTPMVVDW
jgi:hypothetical protein